MKISFYKFSNGLENNWDHALKIMFSIPICIDI